MVVPSRCIRIQQMPPPLLPPVWSKIHCLSSGLLQQPPSSSAWFYPCALQSILNRSRVIQEVNVFIPLFTNYLHNPCRVPDTLLDTWHTSINKTKICVPLIGLSEHTKVLDIPRFHLKALLQLFLQPISLYPKYLLSQILTSFKLLLTFCLLNETKPDNPT